MVINHGLTRKKKTPTKKNTNKKQHQQKTTIQGRRLQVYGKCNLGIFLYEIPNFFPIFSKTSTHGPTHPLPKQTTPIE